MRPVHMVVAKAAEVVRLTADFVSQAARSLGLSAAKKAEGLSLEEMTRRLDGALKALRGDEASTTSAPATLQRTPLQIAEEMVASYSFNKRTGVSSFTVPAGVTDVEAIKSLNEHFRQYLPSFKRDAVYSIRLDRYEKLPEMFPAHCEKRDYSQARQITIEAVVEGTMGEDRLLQEGKLEHRDLVFSDPRDQAIAAALHACKHQGADLFEGLWVRGSIPRFALFTHESRGVDLGVSRDDHTSETIAASGSLSARRGWS